MNEQHKPRDMGGLFKRLDAVCQKVWEEDRTCAIPVQAVAEEAKAELRLLESLTESLEHRIMEDRRTLRSELVEHYQPKISDLEGRLRQSQGTAAGLQEALSAERARVEVLMKDLEAKEQDLMRFKETYLRAETERDSARAKKMGDFAAELEAKDEELEGLWSARRGQLEGEHRKRREEMEAKYHALLGELEQRAHEIERGHEAKESALVESRRSIDTDIKARDARFIELELGLRKQADAMNERAGALEREYAAKRAELNGIKDRMQAEIVEMFRTYRAQGKEGAAGKTQPSKDEAGRGRDLGGREQ